MSEETLFGVPVDQFPRMLPLRQKYPDRATVDVKQALAATWRLDVRRGSRVAVAVGSRGITRLTEVVAAVIARLRDAGAEPFIVPAMGSHAGATAEGQAEYLAGYGITEQAMGVPIRPSMEVEVIGKTPEGIPVHMATEALRSDGIIVVNRVKPHTDFHGPVESGLLKMIAVGLGKQVGAATFHAAVARLNFTQVIASVAREKLQKARFLGGVAMVEDQRHQLARVEAVRAEDLETREPQLLDEARSLMPHLPMDEIDLLIVDYLGKNISGSGIDPNVIGRDAHTGYSAWLGQKTTRKPLIHRIFVRDLTPETHGNATGIGMADFTTMRVVKGIDRVASYMNALTSLAVLSVKLPIHYDDDREVLSKALGSLALADPRAARVIRIRDTLSLEQIQVSEACRAPLESRTDVILGGPSQAMAFDPAGNLI